MLRHAAAPLAPQRPGAAAARPPPARAAAAALFRGGARSPVVASLRHRRATTAAAAAPGQRTTTTASAAATDAPAAAASAPPPPAPASALASSPAAVDAMSALYHLPRHDWARAALSVVVVGASGDLAKKKIFPALFALYYEGLLPPRFQVFGYARSGMTDAEFRDKVARTLACRVSAGAKCAEAQARFLECCFYVSGPYDTPEGFGALHARMGEQERSHFEGEEEGGAGAGGGSSGSGSANAAAPSSSSAPHPPPPPQAHRMFFLSIPPSVFTAAAGNASQYCASPTGWTRVIVEKPFGRDADSSAALGRELARHLTEEQIYRIDHYLGKELIENLTVLRFSNLVFEPLWTRQCIRNVQVIFSEDFGTEGRGGYFDSYGIIRDVIQNHLLQIVALFAMEPPVSLDAEDIRNEKVKVLRAMRPVRPEDVVVGQYRGRASLSGNAGGGKRLPGYLDDETVPPGSICPTFAAVALRIDNARWDGVPFLLKAGKALQKRSAEIRVQFRHVPGNLYRGKLGSDLDAASNELVINIQPKEAIYLKINNKVPGLGLKLGTTRLDLTYAAAYGDVAAGGLPDAYERLLLDVVNGDKRLFIRADELEAAWALFTPMLHHLEAARVAPEPYPYGSRGPVGAHYLAAQYGVRWGDVGAGEDEE